MQLVSTKIGKTHLIITIRIPSTAAKWLVAALFLLLPLSFSLKTFAYCDNPVGCDCCRCPNGMGECLNGYPSCEAACGLVGGYNNQNQNWLNWRRWQMYQQQLLIQERIRKEQLKRERRQKELDEQAQTEANRRKEETETQKRAFIQDRDATTLKGSLGSGLGLKGGIVDTGIEGLKPEANVRDLGGAGAAWKQLNCAAYISGGAMTALTQNAPDFSEFGYLANEAVKALNGDRLGVQCPSAPAMPDAYGKAGYERYEARYKAALEKAKKFAKEMKIVREEREKNLRKLIKAKEKVIKLSPRPEKKMEDSLEQLKKEQRRIDAKNAAKMEDVRQKQREINKENAEKADKMKSAMAAALAAMRKAQAAYNKATVQEFQDMSEIGKAMKAGDGVLASGQ